MNQFQVVAGSGHCGTMWLASVLDSVPGWTWHHELRTAISGMAWQQADVYPPSHWSFTNYWHDIEFQLEHGSVGDSNSWPPEALPDVNDIMPISKVIYLTRDKEKQLRSLSTKSPVWANPPWPEAAERRLDLYAEISGKPRDIRLLVEANDFMPDWLRGAGLDVDVYSLEELTTDIGKLRELAPLTDVELVAWQKRNINQKVFA